MNIEVHEESLTSVHLVIPRETAPTSELGELDEADLELVAGGYASDDDDPVLPM